MPTDSNMVTLASPRHSITKGMKRSNSDTSGGNRPEKRARVLLSEDSDGEASTDQRRTGSAHDDKVLANDYVLSVNEDFARRFEHNKKREELQQRTYTQVVILYKTDELILY